MTSTIEEMGARPAYAYLPVKAEISRPTEGLTPRETEFLAYCRGRRVQSLYLQPYFREKAKRGVKFKTQGHWGPLEHLTAAEGLRSELIATGLLPDR